MSIQLKLRGGTTTEHSTFTGLAREVTVDTDKNTLVVHDGSTAGGVPLLTAATDSTVIPSVATTPSSGGSVGDTVFNTTDSQLYRHNGTSYEVYAGLSGTVNASAPAVTDLLEGSFYFNTTNDTLYILKDISGTMTWTQVVPSVTASGNGIEVLAALPTSGNTEGRMVFLTSDDKLYRYDGTNFIATVATTDLTGYIAIGQIDVNTINAGHIQSNAITAGKILAGEIGTSHLAANSITTAKIATDAITANEIVANAVGAGEIAAGVISSTHLASNSILAGNITAGALTMAKMTDVSEKTTNSVTVQLGAGASVGGNDAGGAYISGTSGNYGLIGTNTAGGNAIAGGTTATSGTSAGVVAVGGGTSSSFGNWDTIGAVGTGDSGLLAIAYSTNNSGSASSYVEIAKGSYSIYTTTGSTGPFTGAHDVLIPNNTTIEPGDIVVDQSVAARKGLSDTITIAGPSNSANQKGVVGVFVDYLPDHVPAALSELVKDGISHTPKVTTQHQGLLANNQVGQINALGEGQINICGEAGNLEIGDLIVSSSTPGKGMKQADDIIRATTVAKVRESVTFSSSSEVKQVACIYLCG